MVQVFSWKKRDEVAIFFAFVLFPCVPNDDDVFWHASEMLMRHKA